MLMASTMVILFPVGVVFLRLVERVGPHAVMQAIGCVFLVVGMGIGILAGAKYNQVSQTSLSCLQFMLSVSMEDR